MKISFHRLFLWHRMWVFILCPGLFKIGGGQHMTCGILVSNQGLNWGHWQWEFRVLTTGLPGSSLFKKQLKDSCACVLSCVRLYATSWTVAHQAPLSLGFARQEYWSGVPLPSPKSTSTNVKFLISRMRLNKIINFEILCKNKSIQEIIHPKGCEHH